MRRILAALIALMLLPSSAFAAIAFDASGTSGGFTLDNPATWTHTTGAGSNIAVVAITFEAANSAPFTGLTIGGVTATEVQVGGVDQNGVSGLGGSGQYIQMWYVLNAPASTALTISVANAGGTDSAAGVSTSYTGVAGGLDASRINGSASTNSFTSALTTIADNSWVVIGARAHGEPLTAGSGVTFRENTTSLTIGDSNAAVHPAGSFSQTITFGTDGIGVIQASFSPTGATAVVIQPVFQMPFWW